jgi:hypothetical protein
MINWGSSLLFCFKLPTALFHEASNFHDDQGQEKIGCYFVERICRF